MYFATPVLSELIRSGLIYSPIDPYLERQTEPLANALDSATYDHVPLRLKFHKI